MKKTVSIILALVLAFSLCACGDLSNVELPPLPTVTPEPTATPEPTPEPTPDVQDGQIIISVETTLEQAYDPQEGTQLILTFSYETPKIEILGRTDAEKAVNEYVAMLDETYVTGEDYGDGQGTGYNNMLTMAEDNYNYWMGTGGGENLPLELSSTSEVSIPRGDAQVLTLLYYNYSYLGGAHGSYDYTGYCFDTQTGELLTLDALSSDPDGLRSFLTDYMVTAVENDASLQERTTGCIPDDDYNAALSALLREGSWYFNNNGMVIFSSLYEISSYAAGIIEFEIPYSELDGHIDEKWIPAEITDEGSFEIVSADDMKEGSTEIIDKLTVSEDGEELYLVSDGIVRNISICSVEYSTTFYETGELWYCSVMNGSALQLQTIIPEGMPNLRLSYTDGSGEHCFYISESGENGKPILADDTIEAVG